METESHKESSEFRHCVLARTQQNKKKNNTMREGLEYSSDIDFTCGANSSKYQIPRKDSTHQMQDGPMDEGLNDQCERNEVSPD